HFEEVIIMATQTESASDVGVTTLIGGIVHDARELFLEQMNLFQVEIKNDVHRTTAALAPLLGGLGVVLAGFVLLEIGGANFLVWAAPALPHWLAYTLVRSATMMVCALLAFWGKSQLDTISPTPDTALK